MDLRIEIEPGSDPIRGVLRTDVDDPGQPFVGWMGLVELIAATTTNPDESASGEKDPI